MGLRNPRKRLGRNKFMVNYQAQITGYKKNVAFFSVESMFANG